LYEDWDQFLRNSDMQDMHPIYAGDR